MKLLIKLLLTAVAVLILAYWLPGVSVAGFSSALMLAVVLGLLRLIVRPVLIVLTLPVTILTLGLFLFVINGIIVLLADQMIGGFHVDNFWIAMLFSLLLSIFQSLLYSLFLEEDR